MNPWRAWYEGGRTYDSRDTPPDELPDDGLLGVVEYLPHESPRRYLHTGYDLYFWTDEMIGGNNDSREENMARYPGARCVRGKWVPHDEMRRVRKEMTEAHEAP